MCSSQIHHYHNTPAPARHCPPRRAGFAKTRVGWSQPAQPSYGQPQGGVQLSFQARRMMAVMGLMNAMVGGHFGQLMSLLGSPVMNGQAAHGPAGAVSACGGFGVARCGNSSGQSRQLDESRAPRVAAGQAKELKAGEEVRGANGTLLKWGKDGNVDISYKDQNSQVKTVRVKDGMISLDGGRLQKLENVGQLLKLPNGDVVGIGNNPSAGPGNQLCRVVMADSTDKVKCEPASATNIYDVSQLERRQTSLQGGGLSVNFSSASLCTPVGMMNFTNVNISQFLGHPVTRVFTEQLLSQTGCK